MKTDELVHLLAAAGSRVDRAAARKRFWMPLALAPLVCVAAVLATVGMRPDWRDAIALPMFWMKLTFPAAVAGAAAMWLRALGHPGARWRGAATVAALPPLALWIATALILATTTAGQRAALVMGNSSVQCVTSISALAIPAFVLAAASIRSLAPTRLVQAGAVAGLVAGAVGAFAYALYCDEMQAPFLAVWYVIGMTIPAVAGALLGPRLLRW